MKFIIYFIIGILIVITIIGALLDEPKKNKRDNVIEDIIIIDSILSDLDSSDNHSLH